VARPRRGGAAGARGADIGVIATLAPLASSRRLATLVRLVVWAFAIVLSVGACSSADVPPQPTTTVPVTNSDTAEPTPTPTYRATGLDLCRTTDLGPLADLSVTVRSTDPAPPSDPGSACEFVLRTGNGGDARLQVEAVSLATVEEAQSAYRGYVDVAAMTSDGAVPGLGDEAVGLAKESEYMVIARSGNLVLTVWLTVLGSPPTPKATLAAKVQALLAATLAAVPRA
jgi:hypothetical protein